MWNSFRKYFGRQWRIEEQRDIQEGFFCVERVRGIKDTLVLDKIFLSLYEYNSFYSHYINLTCLLTMLHKETKQSTEFSSRKQFS